MKETDDNYKIIDTFDALEDLAPKPKDIDPQSIIAHVAQAYGLGIERLLSKERSRQVALPRQVAMYLCRKLIPDTSLTGIGRVFGNKHHTTVLHACRKVDLETQRKASVAEMLDDLTRRLQ